MERSTERRIREAHQQGLREGDASGRNQAAAQLQAEIEKLGRSVAELSQFRPRLMREAEADLVKLAVEIARRVLHRELTVDRSALQALIKAALERLQGQEICRIRVHPEHQEAVRATLARAGSANVQVVGDAALELGGAIFETARGSVDASMSAQLREIELGLADRLERQS